MLVQFLSNTYIFLYIWSLLKSSLDVNYRRIWRNLVVSIESETELQFIISKLVALHVLKFCQTSYFSYRKTLSVLRRTMEAGKSLLEKKKSLYHVVFLMSPFFDFLYPNRLNKLKLQCCACCAWKSNFFYRVLFHSELHEWLYNLENVCLTWYYVFNIELDPRQSSLDSYAAWT